MDNLSVQVLPVDDMVDVMSVDDMSVKVLPVELLSFSFPPVHSTDDVSHDSDTATNDDVTSVWEFPLVAQTDDSDTELT